MTLLNARRALVALAISATAARAQSGPLWDSYKRANTVLTQAAEAHGGVQKIRALQQVAFHWDGMNFAPTQGRLPAWDGAKDNLLGLKENIIIGHLIPAGTGMYRYQEVDMDVAGVPEAQQAAGADSPFAPLPPMPAFLTPEPEESAF